MANSNDRSQIAPNGDQLRIVSENVRALREAQKLTLGQLSARSGVSKAALSKLESENTNPTLETLAALAAGLSTTTAALVTPADSSPMRVVRSDEGVDLTGSASAARLIHVLRSPNANVEVHELKMSPGDEETSATHGEGSWEHMFVIDGSAWVGPHNEAVLLGPGDYAAYPGDRAHGFRTEGDQDARILIFLVVPRVAES